MRKPRPIQGEYRGVARMTEDFPLLEEAHATPMTREDALALVSLVCEAEGLTIPPVQFRKGSPGRSDWKRILLPSDPLPRGGFQQTGYLRAGIVLHELAHYVIARERLREVKPAPTIPHGPRFVRTLDRLTRETECLWC